MEHDDVLEDLLNWQDVSASSISCGAENKHFNPSNNNINTPDSNKKKKELSSNKKCGLQPSAIPINVRANSAPPLSSLSNVHIMEKNTCTKHNVNSLPARASSITSTSSSFSENIQNTSTTHQVLSIPHCVQEKLFDYQVDGVH